MPLLVYRPTPTDHTHENEEFRKVCKVLKRKFRSSNELCVLAGNMNVYGKEYDAFLIRSSSILLMEFKDHGGHIIAAENGPWLAQNGEHTDVIKGGSSRKNPFDQARTNRSTFINALVDAGIPDSAARKLVAAVLFHKPITLENHISEPVQRWLHIFDVDHLHEKIDDIVNPDLDLSNEDIKKLIDKLQLQDSFVDRDYSNVDFLDQWRGKVDEVKVVIPDFADRFVQSVHKAKKITAAYCVFDNEVNPPDVPFELNKKYLVRVEAEPTDELIKAYASIGVKAEKVTDDCVYWQLGDEIQVKVPKPVSEAAKAPFHQLKMRKSSTRLPAWLENYLYSEMNCSYAPEHARFSYNADLTNHEVHIYAGTYLPRSYAENFIIYDNLLGNKTYKEILKQKESISIFSLGAGTGGDVLGIISAIDKHISEDIPIKVIAADENALSLDFFEGAVHRYQRQSKRIVTFKRYRCPIRDEHQLELLSTKIDDGTVDIISVCKIGCELLAKGIFAVNNPYSVILSFFEKKICKTGVFTLLDVTTPSPSGEFIPVLMNKGVSSFVRANTSYSTLLPQSCGCYESICETPCFIQQIITVNHCKKTNDLSKICYRMLGHKPFCDSIVDGNIGRKFILGQNDDGTPYYCSCSENNEDEADAFNVNN